MKLILIIMIVLCNYINAGFITGAIIGAAIANSNKEEIFEIKDINNTHTLVQCDKILCFPMEGGNHYIVDRQDGKIKYILFGKQYKKWEPVLEKTIYLSDKIDTLDIYEPTEYIKKKVNTPNMRYYISYIEVRDNQVIFYLSLFKE